MNLQEIDFSSMSAAQRVLLAEMLWDSVAATPDEIPLTAEQRQELKRRVAALKSGEMISVPWEEARTRLQALLR